jgi:hypothetical protein
MKIEGGARPLQRTELNGLESDFGGHTTISPIVIDDQLQPAPIAVERGWAIVLRAAAGQQK